MPDSRPVKLTFTAEVAQALKAMGHLEVSAEDLEQAFVEASNSSQDLERKIQRATREAEKDVEKLERAIREIPDATDDAADEAGRDFGRIGDQAKDAGKDAGQEFTQNLGSALASGDMGSVVQETLGGLVSGINGATGAVVGAVGGLALAAWGILKAESEKQKQELADLFDITDLITGAIDKTALMEETLADIGGGSLQAGLDKTKELSKTLGISVGDVTAMLTGETNPAVDKMVGHLEESNRELTAAWLNTGQISDEDRKLIDANETILHQHRQQKDELAKVAAQAETYQAGMAGVEDAAKAQLLTSQQLQASEQARLDINKQLVAQTAAIRENLEKMPKDINVRINAQLAGNAGSQLTGSMFGSQYATATDKYP